MKESLLPGERIREYYPILKRTGTSGAPICYLDSAAMALKPATVIEVVAKMLSHYTANIHRSVHNLGDEATEIYESARRKVARFINSESHEIVFTKNATEALNTVAHSWNGRGRIITSYGEHHSNYLPWQEQVTFLRPLLDGRLNTELLRDELEKGDVSLVSLSHVSNVSGAEIDVHAVANLCHSYSALLVVDASQSAPHMEIDVNAMDCDFLVFSGHKLGAPTGTGVLYGKAKHLHQLDWFQKGGGTVEEVHVADASVMQSPPWKFEAGTPQIEAVAGLGKAVDFLLEIGMDAIAEHQHMLTQLALKQIRQKLPEANILGPVDDSRAGPVSMYFQRIPSHNLARGLSDSYSVCARSGFHCAQPLHECLNAPATLRLSFSLYNTPTEVEYAINGLAELVSLTAYK